METTVYSKPKSQIWGYIYATLVSTLFLLFLSDALQARELDCPEAPDDAPGYIHEAADIDCSIMELNLENEILEEKKNELLANYAEYDGFDEDKDDILLLMISKWNDFIPAKCQFHHYDSRKGSAYDAILNRCMVEEKRKLIQFLTWHIDHP